jgi:hypothetical protein
MSFSISIEVDMAAALKSVRETLPKAVPYVAATALSALAGRVQAKVREQMPTSFDRPTPYTVRGVFVKKADARTLEAQVYVPDSQEAAGRGKREYIRPGALGSVGRRQKKTEFLLSRTGFLPAGWVTTPGSKAAQQGYMDGYGNIKPRVYAQIVNVLQIKAAVTQGARNVSARSQKRAKRMGVEAEFFAVAPGRNAMSPGGGWLPPGVYKRTGRDGSKLHQVLKFVSRASYRKLLDIEAVARKEVLAGQQQEFDRAWATVQDRFAARAASRAAGGA